MEIFVPEQKIPAGITIAGIDVGNLNAQEAEAAVSAQISHKLEQTDMVISLGENALTLSPARSNAHWDISGAVKRALSGKESNITLELSLDSSSVFQALELFYQSLGGVYAPSGYYLEGAAPDTERMTGAVQTLVISPGRKGHLADIQESYERILEGYEKEVFQITLEALGEYTEPVPLDLEQIYAQVTIPAVAPRVDPETLEILPGKDGYGFNLEQAHRQLALAANSERIRIPMEFFPSEVTQEDAWFQDTLGSYCTEYDAKNENRTRNLQLACEKLDGLILQPGETLSYNETLGKRTTAAGYLPAPSYVGTELVDEVGGGICQVSSTLYLSSLFAELTVVDRRNHGYPVNYIPLGLDATVNWGTTDLKLRNDYDLPVKILAQVTDTHVVIKIMGVEQRNYYVKMEYRVDDHPSYAAAFRCRYDRETDEEIYRALDHTSTYLENVWSFPGYAESCTEP